MNNGFQQMWVEIKNLWNYALYVVPKHRDHVTVVSLPNQHFLVLHYQPHSLTRGRATQVSLTPLSTPGKVVLIHMISKYRKIVPQKFGLKYITLF